MNRLETAVQVEAVSESLLLLRFGDGIDVETNARVHAAVACLRSRLPSGVVELVPAYASLAVSYDPDRWFDPADSREPAARLADVLLSLLESDAATPTGLAPRTIEIPVCYDAELAPDLMDAARQLRIDSAELAARHAAASYRVAMLGFAPGFPYLLGLDPGLQLPRRAQPRLRVPAGSVAIGGAQTGIYPSELPGGWQLIGRTPWRLFDATRSPPNRLAAGDTVRFVAIGRDDYERLDEHAA